MKAATTTTRAATDNTQAVGQSREVSTFNSARWRPSLSGGDGVVDLDRAGVWRPRTYAAKLSSSHANDSYAGGLESGLPGDGVVSAGVWDARKRDRTRWGGLADFTKLDGRRTRRRRRSDGATHTGRSETDTRWWRQHAHGGRDGDTSVRHR
jgi:hypothetical protein